MKSDIFSITGIIHDILKEACFRIHNVDQIVNDEAPSDNDLADAGGGDVPHAGRQGSQAHSLRVGDIFLL